MVYKRYILVLIAIVLSIILFIPSFIYAIFHRTKKELSEYFLEIAFSIDQMGNVVCAPLFNDFLLKEYNHQFGDSEETVSEVVGYNLKYNNLSPLGVKVAKGIDRIFMYLTHEEKHCEHANEIKQKRWQ